MVEAGMSQRQMATQIGVTQKTIQKWLRDQHLRSKGRSGLAPSFTDEQFRSAWDKANNWTHLARLLTAEQDSATTPSLGTLKRAAEKFDLDAPWEATGEEQMCQQLTPQRDLSSAAVFLAAAWYTMHGARISFTEGARYDFIADLDGNLLRVQVKSSTFRVGTGWSVTLAPARYNPSAKLGPNGRRSSAPYTSDEIDEMFVVTADNKMYRIEVNSLPKGKKANFPGRFQKCEVIFPQPDSSAW